MSEEFAEFWASYPRKTAKLDAIKAYERARRIDTAENILAGLERYKRSKPDYADWCHPATFLNKGRWMDEEDAPPVTKEPPISQHEYERADRWLRNVTMGRCPHAEPCQGRLACQQKQIRIWRGTYQEAS